MGLIRLLVIAALIYIVWRVVKNLLSSPRQDTPPASGGRQELMRKCAQCGVHVPDHEAFTHNGQHFCSMEHQRLYLEHHDQ
ncbi:PP0621 family protein [Alcanivorax sp.]|uniref:PP0621 family protein n=1 Tax=Alcanivorax sp. TaxID=1872427 RepID=UPI00243D5538|nr:PP0621 family protein [Alcanivorax sp.]